MIYKGLGAIRLQAIIFRGMLRAGPDHGQFPYKGFSWQAWRGSRLCATQGSSLEVAAVREPACPGCPTLLPAYLAWCLYAEAFLWGGPTAEDSPASHLIPVSGAPKSFLLICLYPQSLCYLTLLLFFPASKHCWSLWLGATPAVGKSCCPS